MMRTGLYFFKVVVLVIVLGWSFYALSAEAYGNTRKDLKIIAQAVGFIKGKSFTDVDMLVVFAPDNKRSREGADSILNTVGEGFAFGKVRINARKVSLDEAHKYSPDLFVLQNGLGDIARLYAHASQNSILTLSMHDPCMEKNQCVLLIKTSSGIDIFLNRTAAQQSGIQFDAAFRLMVKEK